MVYVRICPLCIKTSRLPLQLIVRSSMEISDDPDDLEGSGLEDVFSGSGENDVADITLDDEDLQLHHLTIGFTCLMNHGGQITLPPPHVVVSKAQLVVWVNS